jgi:hypothetical protein
MNAVNRLFFVLCLLATASLHGQSRLSFDGYNDYVEISGGVDFAPPWTFEMPGTAQRRSALLSPDDGYRRYLRDQAGTVYQ